MKELRIVTIEEIKAQVREDFDGEDNLLKLYGCAAEEAIVKATCRTLEELCKIGYLEYHNQEPEASEINKDWFPSGLKLAILMLAAQSYRVREPVANIAQNPVPFTYDLYVKPYRKL